MLGFGVVLDDCEEDIRIKLMLLLLSHIWAQCVPGNSRHNNIIKNSFSEGENAKNNKYILIYIYIVTYI